MTDDRLPPPTAAGERATLISVSEHQRATLARECHGLDDQQLRTRAVPPSGPSLLWLVRHATEVERSWSRRLVQADDEPAIREAPADAGLGDGETTGPEAFDRWEREVGRSRAFVSAAASLDVAASRRPEADPRHGRPGTVSHTS